MMFLKLKCAKPRHLCELVKRFSFGAVSFDVHSLAHFLDACMYDVAAAHARLLKSHDLARCSSPWNKILNLYCRSGLFRRAQQLFDVIPSRDVVSYNTLISAHARQGRATFESLRLYTRMLCENIKPDHLTLSMLLTTSSMLVEQIHSHSTKMGLNSNAFVGGALVSGYERCRGLEEAIRTFEEIEEMDVVCWNILIDVCARRGSKRHAVDMFCRMRKEGGGAFDCFTLTSVLKTCSERGDLSLGMQLHGCSWKAGLVRDTPIGNALITMYMKCGGGLDSAVEVFQTILDPNIISWTAIIAGLVQNGLAKEAASFYYEMVYVGMMENEFCFTSVLPAFSMLVSLDHGRMIHSRIIKSGFCFNVMVGNALIDMYFKCGSAEDAQMAFETMRNHDTVSWTITILGFGQHGKGEEALQIFRALDRSGTSPDSVTFLALLSTCSHGGLVEEGIKIFHSMVNDYNIKPKREHCACVIDMLGRAGKLSEAEKFIQELGLERDPLAWESLLGTCAIHGATELGERSAEKVMELEPHKDGPYVLLSNIYAEQKMWAEKVKLRGRLDASMLAKDVGYSWSSGFKV